MSFKKFKCIMLPTNEKADYTSFDYFERLSLYESKGGSKKSDLSFKKYFNYMDFINPQHLFITSDEEIKEGDWIYCANGNPRISKAKGCFKYYICVKCKKIIASTDSSLNLHLLSKLFIDNYIEQHNEGNVITDVMVEFEDNSCEEWYGDDYEGEPIWVENIDLKVNPKDNTITIKKVKDSWKREEVINLIHKFRQETYNGYSADKWINTNL